MNANLAKAGAVAFAATAVAVGAFLAGGSSVHVPSGTANIWMDPDGGDCVRNEVPAAYVNEDACQLLDDAYDESECGDSVLMKGGVYGRTAQNIIDGPRTCVGEDPTVFEPAAGERVEIRGNIDFGAGTESVSAPDWVTLRGVYQSFGDHEVTQDSRRGLGVWPTATHITVEDSFFGGFFIAGAEDTIIRDNEIGPCIAFDGQNPGVPPFGICANGKIDYWTSVDHPGVQTERTTIEGNNFFDYGCGATFYDGLGEDDCHHECMYVNATYDLTIARNTFINCANGGDVFITLSGGGVELAHGHVNLLIENNVFDAPCTNTGFATCGSGRTGNASGIGHCGSHAGTDLDNVKVRFNTFLGGSGFAFDNPCVTDDVQVVGNIASISSANCGDVYEVRPTFKYNVWRALAPATCGGVGEVNIGNQDFDGVVVNDALGHDLDAHLAGADGSTPADNLVPEAECPATDIDGTARPQDGATCDAGAYER